MSRHRHRRAQAADIRPGLRHVATAAAVASGTLAVVTPVAGIVPGPAEADLRLAAESVTDPPAGSGDDSGDSDTGTGGPGPRSAPVVGAEIVRDAGLLDAAADAGRAAAEEGERIAGEAADRARLGGTGDCGIDVDDLGAVQDWVAEAAEFLGCAYGEPELIGVSQRANASDHPTGHALDLMVRGERGDRIAECALANAEELGVKYVIWEQAMSHGSGWTEMSDRGGDTANHNDHVHISFEKSAGTGDPDLGRCS
ncbi:hypothetical protein [Pseudonocardia sp. HH130630-07]|uniref:hypothetical protein n=1 Tax=Pseudonocardia sp. HH130630-07 TaxID=1690815 RepID=UPI0012EA6D49|nr:hypothetical protein [Pseudonocardia sp. HH130630-07]